MNDEFTLQLIAVHRPWDLAIFRIIDKPEDDESNHTIKLPELAFVREQDIGRLGQHDLWWSVGYNLDFNEAGLQSSWEMYWSRQSIEVKHEISKEFVCESVPRKIPKLTII